jgi:outer membrane protein assembly factor BamD
MRPTVRNLFIGIILVCSFGCAQKSAKLQKSVAPPDRTLFETGSEYLKKGAYIKSRLAFQTLINTYPDSDMAAESYFAIADSFYEEGGTENLLQAEDQYENFIVFFPTHPKAADAQMKKISANMKLMHSPDRDQQYSYKALQEIKRFLQKFPDSDYVPIARQFQAEVEENLARSSLGIGQFYAERGNNAGARGRYQEIVDQYKSFSGLDDVYFRLANIWEKSNNPEEAAIYYGKIVSGYPFSRLSEEAKARLNALGKPVPPVDAEQAALNQSRIKPVEGFSPLKPLIDFGKAIGFMGPPDRYELAKKAVEAEKGKSADALAAKSEKTGETTDDDIQITTTIYKSASGETKDSTILGTNPAAASGQSNTDKDKRKNTNKTKRKNVKKAS